MIRSLNILPREKWTRDRLPWHLADATPTRFAERSWALRAWLALAHLAGLACVAMLAANAIWRLLRWGML